MIRRLLPAPLALAAGYDGGDPGVEGHKYSQKQHARLGGQPYRGDGLRAQTAHHHGIDRAYQRDHQHLRHAGQGNMQQLSIGVFGARQGT